MKKCTCAFPCGQTEPTCPSSPEYGRKILFTKNYDGESIVDFSRDMYEVFDERFTPQLKEIPDMSESPGFWSGKFTVSIVWTPDND